MRIPKLIKIKNKKKYLIGVFLLFLWFFSTVNFCLAAFLKSDTQTTIETQADKSAGGGYEISNVSNIYGLIQTVINAFLALVGVLLLTYMLYGGYNWMSAQGDEEKVTKAKDTIQRAIIGLIIIVAAYAISVFVMARLEAGTLKGGGGAYNNNPASQSEQADCEKDLTGVGCNNNQAPAEGPAQPQNPDLNVNENKD